MEYQYSENLRAILEVGESPSKNLLRVLGSEHQGKKIGISPERLDPIKPILRKYIAYWREYPDMFVDFLQTGDNPDAKKTLKFYFYQRVFLRIAMRYKYVYAVFPRAYSKSFLSVLILMLRCILYPRSKLFVTSGGKEQSASIIKDKVQELCTLVPALNREVDRRLGKTLEGKDYARYMFKNGSYFDNVAASEKSRGLRRHAGLIEECVGVDGKILNEIIIPIMNIDRRCMDGTTQPEEVLNKSQLYITTSGYKGTFSYDKLIQMLIWMILEPDKAFIMGGTWRIPVLAGLQSKSFITDLKRDGTFNQAAFDREYESKWSGTSDGAYFDGDQFDVCRTIKKAELTPNIKGTAAGYYVISVDVGRKSDLSVVTVIKVLPQMVGPAIKQVVNIMTWADMDLGTQAVNIKKLYYKYHARRVVVDGNGLGQGLVDALVKPSYVDDTGEVYPGFGIFNDDDGVYKKFIRKDTELNAVYVIMANATLNTEAHVNVQVNMSSGKVRFLIDERTAQRDLLSTKMGENMSPEQRAEYLKPYTLTSILKDEMMNLREENEGVNIILKKANKFLRKDKFSSLEYGLYYIKTVEENGKKKKKFNAAEWRFLN